MTCSPPPLVSPSAARRSRPRGCSATTTSTSATTALSAATICAATSGSSTLAGRGRVEACPVLEQRVDHRVADEADAVDVTALVAEVAVGLRRGDQQQVGEQVGDAAVDL